MADNNEFKIDDYLYVNPAEIKRAIMEWVAERQAQKRFSKPVDTVFIKEKGFYSYEASKLIHDLMINQEMADEVFYATEKKLSYNNGQIDNAHALWLIDVDGSEPIVRMADGIRSVSIFKNRAFEVEIDIEQIKSDKGNLFYVVETRNKDEIRRQVGKENEGEFTPLTDEELASLPDEVANKLEDLNLGVEEWKGDFEPFVYIKNNPDNKSDRNYVETELNDIVTQIQKKRDDINFSSVKVVSVGLKNKNKSKEGFDADAQAEKNYKKMAASSVVLRDTTSLEGTASSLISNAIPNTDAYDRAIRTSINTILKKTGGATDVDSKGTVQQSKGEVLMSQGDEYKVSNWKKTNRQVKIKELVTKLMKTYTQILKITKPFAAVKSLFTFISQEEVLSEREQLENAKLAIELGISNKLLIQARYHNMTVLEMYEYKDIKFGGE